MPIRLVTRASAGARASSAACVSDVWAVLAHPARWSEFDPFISSVTYEVGEPIGGGGIVAGRDGGTVAGRDGVETGQLFHAQLRLMPGTIPIEIDHVVNRSSVVVTARLFPGLSEEVEHLVIPSASGGSVLSMRLTLHGPLAFPALIPRWLVRTFAVRLLARTAESGLRELGSEVSSVA